MQLSPRAVSCSPGAREATAGWVTVSVCIAHVHEHTFMFSTYTHACMVGSTDDKTVPTEVKGFNGRKVVDAACSSGDGHTVAVDNKGKGVLW